MLLCPLHHRTGTDALAVAGRVQPRPQGARRRPGRGPAVLGPEPDTGQEVAWPAGTGLKRPDGASDSALLGQARTGRRAAVDMDRPGVASVPRMPTSATTAEDCLWPASLAPFFRHPYPLGSSQTPPPLPSRTLGPSKTQAESMVLTQRPRARTETTLERSGVGNLFFLSFSFLQ